MYRFDRNELHDLVWETPLSTLAKRFNISDVGLAKACRRAEIPLPGLGYWAKLAAAKKVPRSVLPRRGFGKSEEIVVGAPRYWEPRLTDEQIAQEPIPPELTFDESQDELVVRARARIGHVPVPRSLDSPHRLISAVLKVDEDRREKQRKSNYPIWDPPCFESLAMRRKLRLANALLLAASRCGCSCYARGHEELQFTICVGEQQIGVKIEPTKPSGSRRKSSGAGRETLRLEFPFWNWAPPVQSTWDDTAEVPLEKVLTEAMVNLLVLGELSYRRRVIGQHEWRVERKRDIEAAELQRIAEAQRLEEEQLLAGQKNRLDRLLAEVSAWRQASEIRTYVGERVSRVRSVNEQAHSTLQAWAAWALSEADRIDPLLAETHEITKNGLVDEWQNKK